MNSHFDVLVVGAGSAGQDVANACNNAGLNVAIVDYQEFGGTCALRGCDPKKVLLGAAEVIERYEALHELGILNGHASVNWEKLMSFKRTFTDPVDRKTERHFKNAGIAYFRGVASFRDGQSMDVGKHTVSAGKIVLACGSVPRKLGIEGEEHVTLSDEFLNLKHMPESVIFLGGGYISLEFAHLVRRIGAEAMIIHNSDRLLPQFDPFLSRKIDEASREAGIDFIYGQMAVRIEKKGHRYVVHTADGKQHACDLVVHGAGRIANTNSINASRGGVELEKGGIKVNAYMQSVSNPNVYAAGDCAASNSALTPVAEKEAAVVYHNILNGNTLKLSLTSIPSVVFSIPPVATVGLTEQAARAKGYLFDVIEKDTARWYASRRINEHVSGSKILIGKSDGKIQGAHLIGHGVDEIINIFSVAMSAGLTSNQLRAGVFAYPTKGYDVNSMLV